MDTQQAILEAVSTLPADEQEAVLAYAKQLSGRHKNEKLSPSEAFARILELQKQVKPDPEGWTVKDYIAYGRR
jgi:hypothetical protein